jgi:hypothetical protein
MNHVVVVKLGMRLDNLGSIVEHLDDFKLSLELHCCLVLSGCAMWYCLKCLLFLR